jgi:hypothetical protein
MGLAVNWFSGIFGAAVGAVYGAYKGYQKGGFTGALKGAAIGAAAGFVVGVTFGLGATAVTSGYLAGTSAAIGVTLTAKAVAFTAAGGCSIAQGTFWFSISIHTYTYSTFPSAEAKPAQGMLVGIERGAYLFSVVSTMTECAMLLQQTRWYQQRMITRQQTIQPQPQLISPNSLSEQDAADIQKISNKYNIRIDVGGSRAQGTGRNINRHDLPVDKGPGTRSDIDFIFDTSHKNAEEIYNELKQVGGGAGRMHPDSNFLYRFSTAPEEMGPGWRFRFEPCKTAQVVRPGSD